MFVVLVIVIVLFIGISLFVFVYWGTHKEMTIENSEKWDYATFKYFLQEYTGYGNWEREKRFPESYFGKGDDCVLWEIHASILKFNGKGMVLYPWSYVSYLIWSKRNRVGPKNHRQKGIFGEINE